MKVTFWLPGEPVAQARARTGKGFAFYPVKSASYRKWAVLQLKIQNDGRLPLDGPIRLQITTYRTRPKSNHDAWPIGKPDWDNYGKMISDALGQRKGAGVITDDCRVCDGRVVKRWALGMEPGVEVVLEPL